MNDKRASNPLSQKYSRTTGFRRGKTPIYELRNLNVRSTTCTRITHIHTHTHTHRRRKNQTTKWVRVCLYIQIHTYVRVRVYRKKRGTKTKEKVKRNRKKEKTKLGSDTIFVRWPIYLKVDRVDSCVVRRCVFFRVIAAIRVVVNIRQRATRPELISQVNVQVFAAGLRWTGAGTLHRQRGLQYPGWSRGAGAHRTARRGDLSTSIVSYGHQTLFVSFTRTGCRLLTAVPTLFLHSFFHSLLSLNFFFLFSSSFWNNRYRLTLRSKTAETRE